MRNNGEAIYLSPSDLVGHLSCRHLTQLDLAVTVGTLKKPKNWDPLLEIFRERGRLHEKAFVEHLRQQGYLPVEIPGVDITPSAVHLTKKAMEGGQPIILQGALHHQRWAGRADVLRRVEKPSTLGSWAYEVIDTKLARKTKAGAVLQLCVYAHLLQEMQGAAPEYIHVVAPWSDFVPQTFRFADFGAYFRRTKAALEAATEAGAASQFYPDPKEQCEVCRWEAHCDQRRRSDDHLCLVAGITKNQTSELQRNGIATVATLAKMSLPLSWKPQRGATQSYERARDQARIQMESREAGELRFVLLPVIPEAGLCLLPPPSAGDIFLDIEGDSFVGEHGFEYLFGYQFRDENGKLVYVADWAFDRKGEKAIFERFVDFVTARLKDYPDIHIYHYSPYEPSTLKRLMGRYASRENEIDNLLRRKAFVDLYNVIRHTLRAGVESYSIKQLEPLYRFTRQIRLLDANSALVRLQACLELDNAASISDGDKRAVQGYNEDDCSSALALRDWLEEHRTYLIQRGTNVPRPEPGKESAGEELTERQELVKVLVECLTADVPLDSEQRTVEQQARWLLAHILDWHRRESKATWWEYFRLAALTADELVDERAALSKLSLVGVVDTTKTGIPTHRYRFEQQDTDLRGDEELRAVGGNKIGNAVTVSTINRTIDIKKMKATADLHSAAIFAHKIYDDKEQADALFRLGEYVAAHGIEGDGDYEAARALLLRKLPRIEEQPIRHPHETVLDAALRVAGLLEGGIFPIQGPPGTGKTFTGARMICKLVKQGKKVGVTANSHKVIRNLIDKVLEAAKEMSVDLCCIQKAKDREPDTDHLLFAKDNNQLLSAMANGQCQVAGATHFLWSREDAYRVLDVLVVDEAAQMSLANVLAVSQAARTVILLGDPQQLEQPMQGAHPDGTGVSALQHILGCAHTLTPDRGLFLEQTWRLNPEICGFNSELFYDDKLVSKEGCECQKILSEGSITGSGLRYLRVDHTGNKSSSIEEADAIVRLVQTILASKTTWVDRNGKVAPLTLSDILIITPYNAQVFEIQQRLPEARVGTVDKFQGQEAPIAIYSMATSSYADAPRGMEFLYSSNRLNVAISRAQCLAILVASPEIFEAECKTPRQMQLANAFCRYLELATPLEV